MGERRAAGSGRGRTQRTRSPEAVPPVPTCRPEAKGSFLVVLSWGQGASLWTLLWTSSWVRSPQGGDRTPRRGGRGWGRASPQGRPQVWFQPLRVQTSTLQSDLRTHDSASDAPAPRSC